MTPYRVQPLDRVEVGPEELVAVQGGRLVRLCWREVACVLAAEVGEPEGVRAVAFDVVVGDATSGYLAYRFGREPGSEAERTAACIEGALRPAAVGPGLRDLAKDAVIARCYPDVEGFEIANRDWLGGSPSPSSLWS